MVQILSCYESKIQISRLPVEKHDYANTVTEKNTKVESVELFKVV